MRRSAPRHHSIHAGVRTWSPEREWDAAFADDEVLRCDSADVHLHEGPLLKGGTVVRVLVRRADD